MTEAEKIACPFVYAKGVRCPGHIVRVEAFKADLRWELQGDGTWKFGFSEPRSHYHVYCSENGNHASAKPDNDQMKFFGSDMPPGLLAKLT